VHGAEAPLVSLLVAREFETAMIRLYAERTANEEA
jgi:hypothetical protein